MTDDPNEQGAPVPGLRRIDHVGVAIDDLAEAGRLLADTLGLARVRGTETAGLRTAFYRCGDAPPAVPARSLGILIHRAMVNSRSIVSA